MSKNLIKKYGGRKETSATIPKKRTKVMNAMETINIQREPFFSVQAECTIERRVSVVTEEEHFEANDMGPSKGVYEVVCCNHCTKFEKQLEIIEKQNAELKAMVEAQGKALMDAISAQKVATEQLVRQEAKHLPVKKFFPVCDVEELKQLEDKITPGNRDVYESAVSAIFCNNMRNIGLLLKSDVVKAVNVDGSHGKIGLKAYPNVYSVLTGAIAKMPYKGLSPDESLRKAINFEKAKFFKQAYRLKKKISH